LDSKNQEDNKTGSGTTIARETTLGDTGIGSGTTIDRETAVGDTGIDGSKSR
jgi:UDP-3-O-[3-hydroxymyristoyl] glucosamine N-acyltransferase